MLIPHQQGSVDLNSASFSPCSRRSPKSCLLSSEQLTRQCPAAVSTAAKAWHLQTCEWRGQLGSHGRKDKSTLLSRISLETGNTTANKEPGVGRRSSLTVEHCAPDLQGKHNSSPLTRKSFLLESTEQSSALGRMVCDWKIRKRTLRSPVSSKSGRFLPLGLWR